MAKWVFMIMHNVHVTLLFVHAASGNGTVNEAV